MSGGNLTSAAWCCSRRFCSASATTRAMASSASRTLLARRSSNSLSLRSNSTLTQSLFCSTSCSASARSLRSGTAWRRTWGLAMEQRPSQAPIVPATATTPPATRPTVQPRSAWMASDGGQRAAEDQERPDERSRSGASLGSFSSFRRDDLVLDAGQVGPEAGQRVVLGGAPRARRLPPRWPRDRPRAGAGGRGGEPAPPSPPGLAVASSGGGDRHPAEPLEQDLGGLLVDVQVLDRCRPVGLGRPAPLDPLVARPLEERQCLPAGLILDLLAPALLLLELVVGLLLGLGVFVLFRLGVPLEDGGDFLSLPRVLGLQGAVVDLVLLGELLRRRLVLLLLPILPAAEPQLDLRFALGAVGDQGFQVVQGVGLDLDQWRLRHVAGILRVVAGGGWLVASGPSVELGPGDRDGRRLRPRPATGGSESGHCPRRPVTEPLRAADINLPCTAPGACRGLRRASPCR